MLCCWLVPAAAAVIASYTYAGWHKWVLTLRFMVPEPEGLSEALLALPRRRLTQEERLELRHKGVLRVRGVIPNHTTLETLKTYLSLHMMYGDELPPTYWMNGAARALLRDSPIGDILSSSVLEGGHSRMVVRGMQVWAKIPHTEGGGDPGRIGDVHNDHRIRDPSKPSNLMTVWVALTNATQAMGFYIGSHEHQIDLQNKCNQSHEDPRFTYKLDKDCVDNNTVALESKFGHASFRVLDAEAGDIFVFNGSMIHAGLTQDNERFAACIRAFVEELTTHPKACEYHKVVHGLGGLYRAEDFQIFPRKPEDWDCMPWVISPDLAVSLPMAPPASNGYITEGWMRHTILPFVLGEQRVHPLWTPEAA